MTVKELIEKLKEYPEDAGVFLRREFLSGTAFVNLDEVRGIKDPVPTETDHENAILIV